MHTFHSISAWETNGRLCFAVANPSECHDFAHLIGQEASIDGRAYRVANIERNVHAPPWREGETIGIMTDMAADEGLRAAGFAFDPDQHVWQRIRELPNGSILEETYDPDKLRPAVSLGCLLAN